MILVTQHVEEVGVLKIVHVLLVKMWYMDMMMGIVIPNVLVNVICAGIVLTKKSIHAIHNVL